MEKKVRRSYITELQRAFKALTADVAGLRVEVVGRVRGENTLVHPTAGFEALLTRSDGAAVALYVSANYAELAVWPRGVHVSHDEAVREPFAVRLAGEYRWGDSVFPNAGELAAALIGYMQYRLDSLTAEKS